MVMRTVPIPITSLPHAATTGQTVNDHHDEGHTVVSHSDTTGTGAELDTLTDGSQTALHTHAGLDVIMVAGSATAAGVLESPDLNVSSVTDVATGNKTVNYTTAFTSVVYAVALGMEANAGDKQIDSLNRATGSVDIFTRTDGVDLVDLVASWVMWGVQ